MRGELDLNERRISKQMVLRIAIVVLEVVIVIVMAFVITHYGLVRMEVSDENMKPTLNMSDNLIVNKMSYKIHKVHRNDIAVILENGSEHIYYSVVRIIGLPGEKVQIKSGKVYIDGKKMKEKCNFPSIKNGGLALDEITLDSDEYFVLGDNRNSALDSRNATIGNVERSQIIGKAWIRIKPFAFVNGLNEFKDQ